MQATRLPALRGWSWLADGFRLFRRNPALLTFLVFGYFFLLLLVNLVPFIGWIAASLFVPPFTVSVMNGCRAVERGEAVQLNVLLSGFRRNRPALLLLGALYLGATLLVFLLATSMDGGALADLFRSHEAPDARAIQALRLPLLLMVPVVMAFWFAPMLAAWNDLSAPKSLFFSAVAAFRNWRAFLVYAVGVSLVSTVLPGLLLALFELISAALTRIAAVAITLPMLFVFVPTLFASFYVSYRDVFVAPPDARP